MSTPFTGDSGQGWSSSGPTSGQGSPPPQDLSRPDYGQQDYSQVQPHYGTPVGEEPVRLASWGARLGALLIDSVFLFALQMALVAIAAALSTINETLGTVVMGIAYLGVLIWYMLLEAGPYGQTPGKAAVKIQVRKADGQMLSKGRSVGRYFGRILSTLPFGLGYLWPLWDSENRTFHDMVVSSRVVSVRESVPFGQVLKGPFMRSRP